MKSRIGENLRVIVSVKHWTFNTRMFWPSQGTHARGSRYGTLPRCCWLAHGCNLSPMKLKPKQMRPNSIVQIIDVWQLGYINKFKYMIFFVFYYLSAIILLFIARIVMYFLLEKLLERGLFAMRHKFGFRDIQR